MREDGGLCEEVNDGLSSSPVRDTYRFSFILDTLVQEEQESDARFIDGASRCLL